ncbi:MAG: glycosyltransferase, partial [bacterium]
QFLLSEPEQSLMEWLEAHLPPDCGICRRHFYITIQDKATWRKRRAFLEALSDLGLTLYGPHTWTVPEIAGPLASNYAGRMLDYDTELSRVYASSEININLFHTQCRRAANARIYDVLACGGFLITDDNSGLHDEFIDGEHLVVARSPEEMREKAAYYLNHPDLRKQIAEAGQKLVLERHTYRHRLRQLLDIAELGGS